MGICPSNFLKGPCDSRAQGPFSLSIFICPAQHSLKNPGHDWALCRAAVALLRDTGDEPRALGTAERAKNH